MYERTIGFEWLLAWTALEWLVVTLCCICLLTLFSFWGWIAERHRRRIEKERADTWAESQHIVVGKYEAVQQGLQEECISLRRQVSQLETHLASERATAQEKLSLLTSAHNNLMDSFKALSADALRHNSESFLQLASSQLATMQSGASSELKRRHDHFEALVDPIRQTLSKMDNKLEEFDRARMTSHTSLQEQVNGLLQAQLRCQQETSNLVRALRTPHVRGKWGEIQLKRVVEMAGMVEMCDFVVQETTSYQDERRRPDMVVRLPGGKQVVIDAKTPLHAYLEAIELVDEGARIAKLREHARHLRNHIDELSKKSYWDQFQPAPEFAILFIPGEMFFSAALEQDPTLIERGVEQKIILATPTTLIALLRAVAYGWRQEKLAENAQQISAAGRILYERLGTFTEHMGHLRRGLEQAIKAYNQSIGSFEGRVMVAARKFHDLGISSEEEIRPLEAIDSICRTSSSEVINN